MPSAAASGAAAIAAGESGRARTPTDSPRAKSTTGAPLSADPNALAFAKIAGESLAKADAKVQEQAARSAAAEEARAYAARVKAAAAAKRRGSQPELATTSDAEAPVRPSAPAHELVRDLVSDAVPTENGAGALSASSLIAAAGGAPEKAPRPRLLEDTAAFEPVELSGPQDANVSADHVVVRPSVAKIQEVAAVISGATDVAVSEPVPAASAAPQVVTQPVSASQVVASQPVSVSPTVVVESSQSVTAPVRPIDESAQTTPFLRADPADVQSHVGEPITISEGPSTTVAVADVVTVTSAADMAVVTASPRIVIADSPPAHDGPPVPQMTGEIGARTRPAVEEPKAVQPSVLVDEVSAVQSDLAAVHAAAAAAAKRPATAPPIVDAASASKEREVSDVRRDAAAFSADEEAFFNRAESHTYSVPKIESFDDLDEGYEPPPSFWSRVFGKDKKKK